MDFSNMSVLTRILGENAKFHLQYSLMTLDYIDVYTRYRLSSPGFSKDGIYNLDSDFRFCLKIKSPATFDAAALKKPFPQSGCGLRHF